MAALKKSSIYMRYKPGESEQWPEAEKNKSADSANKRETMEVV